MKRRKLRTWRMVAILVAACSAGCGARRELTVTSEPSGAIVYLNGQEAGRTPFTTEFTWYGTYDVVAEVEGSEPLVTKRRVTAPAWQWFPIDFFADLIPGRPTDRRTMHLDLAPSKDQDDQALITRAGELRSELNADE